MPFPTLTQTESSQLLADMTVLVVDGCEEDRKVTAEMLKIAGASVLLADSVRSALHLIDVMVPDAILADLIMPGQSGHDLMEILRQRDARHGGKVPVIAVSGRLTLWDEPIVASMGFRDFIVKPVTLERLIESLLQLATPKRTPAPVASEPATPRVFHLERGTDGWWLQRLGHTETVRLGSFEEAEQAAFATARINAPCQLVVQTPRSTFEYYEFDDQGKMHRPGGQWQPADHCGM